MGLKVKAHLFEVALLAGASLGILVMQDVQMRLSLLKLQELDLGLQLIQLLLQVFALLHVLHPKHTHTHRERNTTIIALKQQPPRRLSCRMHEVPQVSFSYDADTTTVSFFLFSRIKTSHAAIFNNACVQMQYIQCLHLKHR